MKFKKERKTILILLGVSILLIPIGYLILNPELIGLCPGWYESGGVRVCRAMHIEFALSLKHGAKYLIAPLAILLLLPQAFRTWKKFTYWALPITLLLIVATPEFIGGLGFLGGQPGISEGVPMWGTLFLIISLIIIGISAFRQRKKNS